MFLFSTPLNIILTAFLLLIYIATAIIINKVIMKRQEAGKKGIIWFYLLLFVLFVVFVGLILWFFGLDYTTQFNNLWNSLNTGIGQKVGAIIGTVITIFITMLLIKVSNFLIKKASQKEGPRQKRITTILKVVKSIIKYFLEIVALLVILSLWGVNVLPALAGLGIMGIVIGLGAQSMISDFIAGFFIIFEHHFDVGDIVEINGFKGEVIDIGLKSTRVRNWKGDIKILSNGSVTNIINYSFTNSVAIIEFGIAYSEDIQKTIDILKKELPKYRELYPEIIEDPNVIGVTSLEDSSVNMKVLVKTETEKHYAVERAVRQGIKEILDKNNIEIPFPQVVVHKSE
ncbi:mechanosensitive ion channel family protein [Candidatus Izemoplasma sp. B36]|uniref:mechanosensitive ion channel family protein n=1 Tax=Candidatus Izemoplasma sp. B36 TaxID=3242468 RepID=UPI0035590788